MQENPPSGSDSPTQASRLHLRICRTQLRRLGHSRRRPPASGAAAAEQRVDDVCRRSRLGNAGSVLLRPAESRHDDAVAPVPIACVAQEKKGCRVAAVRRQRWNSHPRPRSSTHRGKKAGGGAGRPAGLQACQEVLPGCPLQARHRLGPNQVCVCTHAHTRGCACDASRLRAGKGVRPSPSNTRMMRPGRRKCRLWSGCCTAAATTACGWRSRSRASRNSAAAASVAALMADASAGHKGVGVVGGIRTICTHWRRQAARQAGARILPGRAQEPVHMPGKGPRRTALYRLEPALHFWQPLLVLKLHGKGVWGAGGFHKAQVFLKGSGIIWERSPDDLSWLGTQESAGLFIWLWTRLRCLSQALLGAPCCARSGAACPACVPPG